MTENRPVWRKSSQSAQGTSEQGVEVARLPHAISIRDGKAPDAGHITLTTHTFAALLDHAKQGELPH
ncbi:DUF397 domain-containing protein [Actinomadura mexicana]|uniref:DUF397 domain-containing protein n=1 Tax=Actinomadura mexicana TaxID=134959 RepID=A0A239CPG9_9ACTN|nr:DUF397 domain-containing protein [Actinomadura mexicana]SNS22136.1 protein of unknown function [Actinomadura mexicana]